jgi:hypothetical protein
VPAPLIVAMAAAGGLVLVGLVFQMRDICETAAKASWPTTRATVTASGLAAKQTMVSVFDRYLVDFSYAVDGSAVAGLFYSDKAKDFAALAAKYAAGAVFDVFYNPERPAHVEVRDRLGRMGVWSWRLIAYLFYFAAALTLMLSWAVISGLGIT